MEILQMGQSLKLSQKGQLKLFGKLRAKPKAKWII
jgi:hypothetical protein